MRGDMNAKMLLRIIAMTAEEYQDPKNVKTDVGTSQQWKANLLPDMIACGTKTSEVLSPLKVERGRPRELGLMGVHNMYELVESGDERSCTHEHAQWLQYIIGDEVRCRLAGTQLAIVGRLDVTQRTPPLMVAKLLLTIAALHGDETEFHDWVVEFWDVSVALYHAKMEGVGVREPA